jgi:hypothetical protein
MRRTKLYLKLDALVLAAMMMCARPNPCDDGDCYSTDQVQQSE